MVGDILEKKRINSRNISRLLLPLVPHDAFQRRLLYTEVFLRVIAACLRSLLPQLHVHGPCVIINSRDKRNNAHAFRRPFLRNVERARARVRVFCSVNFF